ncbi:hypothetical protein Q7P36_008280 [Cladosporium allicinum]
MANPNRGKRPRGDEEQDGNKRQRTHQNHLGGKFLTIEEMNKIKLEDEIRRRSAASATMRPPGTAPPANQAFVEDAPEETEEGPSRRRSMTPTPSTQAHRQVGDGVVDLTSDGSQEPPRAARPRAAASVAPGVPGPASAAPAINISLLDGKLQGSPTEIPAKALHKYGTKFRQQAKECNKREGRDDIIVHERLVAVVRLLEQARDLASLVAIHKRHGEDALITAHEMLTKEHKLYTKQVGQIQDLPVRSRFRKDVLAAQTVRVSNMEAAMDFCDKLVSDVVGLPLGVRKIKIQVKIEV